MIIKKYMYICRTVSFCLFIIFQLHKQFNLLLIMVVVSIVFVILEKYYYHHDLEKIKPIYQEKRLIIRTPDDGGLFPMSSVPY